MTIIYIENVLGSGQVVTIAETFKQQTIHRSLLPGESGRFLVSPFKSIVVNESASTSHARDDVESRPLVTSYPAYVPTKMTMHGNDD
jgi:hypothetical protein